MKLTLFEMDAIRAMGKIPDKSVDAIITDVPYNLGNRNMSEIAFKNRENMGKANSVEWNRDFDTLGFLPEAKRILKPEGSIFIYCHHNQFGKYVEWLDQNFDVVSFGAWHKTNPTPQVRKVSFLSSLELWVSAWNKKHKFNFTYQDEMHNFIESPIAMGSIRTVHPAQKPVEAMIPLIKASTNIGDTVLDPFAGSGTTMYAASSVHRNSIAIEKNPKYVGIIKKRMQWNYGFDIEYSYYSDRSQEDQSEPLIDRF